MTTEMKGKPARFPAVVSSSPRLLLQVSLVSFVFVLELHRIRSFASICNQDLHIICILKICKLRCATMAVEHQTLHDVFAVSLWVSAKLMLFFSQAFTMILEHTCVPEDVHVFGHTHYGWCSYHDGTRFVQACCWAKITCRGGRF